MQAEPKLASDTRRDAAAAAAMPDYAYLWKVDLQSAHRYWHNHSVGALDVRKAVERPRVLGLPDAIW